MEKVASHINEMQKIYEDYGTVFDQLAAEQSGTDRQVSPYLHTGTKPESVFPRVPCCGRYWCLQCLVSVLLPVR